MSKFKYNEHQLVEFSGSILNRNLKGGLENIQRIFQNVQKGNQFTQAQNSSLGK